MVWHNTFFYNCIHYTFIATYIIFTKCCSLSVSRGFLCNKEIGRQFISDAHISGNIY